jgi:menaquinone-dependent protoporphyrinogen oxidase
MRRKQMNKKILVTYSTKSGSTGEVADAIGKALRERGMTVNVYPARDVTEVSSYDAVIAGTPILYGKWHPEVVRFLEKQQEFLSRIPVAFFITCMELTKTDEENRSNILIYIDPLLGRPPRRDNKFNLFEKGHLLSAFLEPMLKKVPEIKPSNVGVFRGKLDYSKLDFFSSLVMKLIWLIYKRAPEGDFRNWEAIQSWAASLRLVVAEES